jgi:CheY-like chemotaxis protein
LLAVRDSGSGIARDDLPRVFEPFFTTKEMGKGTGLGLAIVYGIVKQSGGYIWVYSEPGLGTTFKLYFPVTSCNVNAEPHNMAVADPPDGETVLVVEDDEAIRVNVCDCLKHLGYAVLEAASGESALEICESANVDLMMTDLVMPGMSGREVAARVSLRHPEIRLMYTSGYTEDGAARRELLQDGTIFLEKPYTVADLARTVRRALFATPGTRAESIDHQSSKPTSGSC